MATTGVIRAGAAALLFLTLPVLTLPVLAVPASAETIGARYDIFTGGFRSLSIQARAAVDESAYGIEADLKTNGIIDWILRFTQKIESRGTPGQGAATNPNPRLYVSNGTFFGTHRSIRLDYRTDGRIDALLEPPNDDDDGRMPVPEAMKLDTIDPISTFVALNRAAAAGGSPCNAKLPVFDGRRRFNLIFEDDGPTVVEQSHYSVFAGPALRCKVQMERLAGFQLNPRFNARTPRVSILYVARFGESGMWLPVRLESDSSFGLVIGHLVEVDAPVKPLGRGPRPAS